MWCDDPPKPRDGVARPQDPHTGHAREPREKGAPDQDPDAFHGWFSGYTRYIEAQADQGEQLLTSRLGKGIWEQFYLVFDTFVPRAQFPLQYVFADHWLLDAWIVDEQTRSKPSRLWLTLLIDAYSRSILGMTLLSENPCIESIQQALHHAIWEKTSHFDLGIE